MSTRRARLIANESPWAPLGPVRDALDRAAADAHRYPSTDPVRVDTALAARLEVDPGRVFVGPGSSGVLHQLLATLPAGSEVVHPWRSFEAYPALCRLAGTTPVPVPLRGHRMDLGRMLDAIGERTRAVVLCTPNNPTGTQIGGTELDAFLAAVPPSCLVVLDEAYHDYVADPHVDGLARLDQHHSLVVLRSFSKAYGLAALRAGFLGGPHRVVEDLRRRRLPFSISRFAEEAVLACWEPAAQAELARRVAVTVAERTMLADRLRGLGHDVPESQANFLWLPCGAAAAGVGRRCRLRGVDVRCFPDEGIRVTIGAPEDNAAFLDAVSDSTRTPVVAGGRPRTP